MGVSLKIDHFPLPNINLYFFLIGFVLTAVVTLDSIEIYTTHEWIPNSKPTVYFQCKGENKTILPDVKSTDHMYSFNNEESWQVNISLKTFNSVLKLSVIKNVKAW